MQKLKTKIKWKKIFAMIVILLFIGTIVSVALINIFNNFILNKTP